MTTVSWCIISCCLFIWWYSLCQDVGEIKHVAAIVMIATVNVVYNVVVIWYDLIHTSSEMLYFSWWLLTMWFVFSINMIESCVSMVPMMALTLPPAPTSASCWCLWDMTHYLRDLWLHHSSTSEIGGKRNGVYLICECVREKEADGVYDFYGICRRFTVSVNSETSWNISSTWNGNKRNIFAISVNLAFIAQVGSFSHFRWPKRRLFMCNGCWCSS